MNARPLFDKMLHRNYFLLPGGGDHASPQSDFLRILSPPLHRPQLFCKVINASKNPSSPSSRRSLPKNLRYPRRAKIPPDRSIHRLRTLEIPKEDEEVDEENGGTWNSVEIETLASLFERRIPQKTFKPRKQGIPQRKPPLPESPSPKIHIRKSLHLRSSVASRVFKNPDALVHIAREIANLPEEEDASEILQKWGPFLRKGSLSMTIKELGHMNLPHRALQTLCWAQTQPLLFPDDRILASAVEVLARSKKLKIEAPMERFLSSASRSVMEAMARGFIRAGNVDLTRKILLFAKDNRRILDPGVHAKLALEVGKNPDRNRLAEVLLEELAERPDLDLRMQDCTAIMKICIRLRRFEDAERLFCWFKMCRGNPSIAMYTTILHGRFESGKLREAMAEIWEMEERDLALDLPAYRVVIRLCVALGDIARVSRYFSRLKEAGFAPTYGIFRDVLKAYASEGRIARCRQICRELEAAGWRLDGGMQKLLREVEGLPSGGCSDIRSFLLSYDTSRIR